MACIAAIILNYNDSGTTEKLVKKIKDFKSIDKIIVVDNHSTDNSFERLSKLSNSRTDVIRTKDNKGYATGNNYGVWHAISKYNAEYIIIANPDVVFEENCIKEMKNTLASINESGAITCKMTLPDGSAGIAAWKIPSFFDCIIEESFVLTRLLNYPLQYKVNSEEMLSLVEAVAGSFFMIKADVFKEIGGFDDNTFLYYEENILAYKLKEKGYKNFCLENITYIHNHSVSIDKTIKNNIDKFRIEYNSRKYYCKEYLKCGRIKLLFLSIMYRVGILEYVLYKQGKRT